MKLPLKVDKSSHESCPSRPCKLLKETGIWHDDTVYCLTSVQSIKHTKLGIACWIFLHWYLQQAKDCGAAFIICDLINIIFSCLIRLSASDAVHRKKKCCRSLLFGCLWSLVCLEVLRRAVCARSEMKCNIGQDIRHSRHLLLRAPWAPIVFFHVTVVGCTNSGKSCRGLLECAMCYGVFLVVVRR